MVYCVYILCVLCYASLCYAASVIDEDENSIIIQLNLIGGKNRFNDASMVKRVDRKCNEQKIF